MQKIDILITMLGIASYLAIMFDLYRYENKIAQFEAIQEKRRLYAQIMADRHKAELAKLNAESKKKQNKVASLMQDDEGDLSAMMEKVGALQKLENSGQGKSR